MAELCTYAAEKGAQFIYNTRARQLVRGEDNKSGRVSAVIAEDADSAGDPGTFPSLYVDINGRRFTNEDIPGQTFADTVEELPCKVWWQLADAQYPNQLKWSQPGHGATMSFSGDIDAWNAAIETGDRATIEAMIAEQGVSTSYAWTVEELADAISCDPAVLSATVERYNQLCADGYDADFGKQAKRLFPLQTPPFFYSTNTWNFLVMAGGLKSNERAEVLDRFGNPIPGLWACGNVQGGRFAYNYPTIIPGISHSMCLTYGRIAGAQAAASDESVVENPSRFKEDQLAQAAATAEAGAAASYVDGVYEAEGTGIGGKVPVTVTVEGGKVASVEVGDNSETQGIGSKAIDQLPAAIVAANGLAGVDGLSGATVTSSAIFAAVEDCLAQASL